MYMKNGKHNKICIKEKKLATHCKSYLTGVFYEQRGNKHVSHFWLYLSTFYQLSKIW